MGLSRRQIGGICISCVFLAVVVVALSACIPSARTEARRAASIAGEQAVYPGADACKHRERATTGAAKACSRDQHRRLD